MEQDNRQRNESVFSRKIRAGRRRTYFFDVRTTRANDYYLTITESKKRHDGNGYERHKIFLYKEDFNKFIAETTEVVNFIKSKMPDFDFDAFNHVYENQDGAHYEEHHEETDHSSDKEQSTESDTQREIISETKSEDESKPENFSPPGYDDDLKM